LPRAAELTHDAKKNVACMRIKTRGGSSRISTRRTCRQQGDRKQDVATANESFFVAERGADVPMASPKQRKENTRVAAHFAIAHQPNRVAAGPETAFAKPSDWAGD